MLVFACWLLVTIALSYGTTSLQVTPDNRIFYSESNERFIDLQNFESKYLPNNNIIFAIYSDGPITSVPRGALEWLEEKAWLVDQTLRVDSIANYPIVTESSRDSFATVPLLEALCGKVGPCDAPANWVQSYPEIVGRLVSSDAEAFATVLTLNVALGTTEEIGTISAQSRALMDNFRVEFPNLKIAHTGGVPMMQAFADASDEDSKNLLPLASLLILLISMVLLRSIKASLILIAIGLSSAISSLGLAGYLGMTINTATALTSVVVLTVVIASTMHVVVSFLNDITLYDNYESAKNALAVNVRPVTLATLTSVLGFLSLNFADAPPLGQLGSISAFGIGLGGVFALTVVPSWLCNLSFKNHSGVRTTNIATWVSAESRTTRSSKALLVALIVGISGLTLLNINDDFVSYFDTRFTFRVETDKIEEVLASPNHIELDIRSKLPEGVFDKSYISSLDSFSRELRQHKLIANVYGFANILEKAKAIANDSEQLQSSEELAQLFLVFELSLGYGQSTSDFVDPATNSSRMSILLRRSTSQEINALKEEIETLVAQSYPNLSAIVTGENIPVASLTIENFASMAWGIIISIAAVSVLIAFVYKSWLLGFIAFISISIPIATTFGIWGWLFRDIGLASVVIVSVALGIVIDDAIHFISRFQGYVSDGGRDAADASALTVRVVGAAIIITSAALTAGFAVVGSSGFGINFAMGVCMVLVVSISLLVNLIGIPAALRHYKS